MFSLTEPSYPVASALYSDVVGLIITVDLALAIPLIGQINGDPEHCLPHVLNVSLPGPNSEAAMVSLKGLLALSNGLRVHLDELRTEPRVGGDGTRPGSHR